MTEKMSVNRRRTITRIVPVSMIGHSKKQSHESSRLPSDSTSDMLNKSNASNGHVRMENTFRVGPGSHERFDATAVDKVMRDVLESRLCDVEYERDECIAISKELASDIQHRIKIFGWRRYKLVCHVALGQNSSQGVHVVSRCVWDEQADNYSCVRYRNKSLFAVAQCYGVYFE